MGRAAHIEIDHVSHKYTARGPLILDDISLKIEPGRSVALVGRSGCGKSTLLQIAAGLLKPSAGTIWIDGRRVSKPCSKWNVMFQKPSLYPWMSVSDNAGLGLKFAGKAALKRSRVLELLELVQLADLATRNVQQLSGGQQQRVALARSLAVSPELLLLDEPFSSLDVLTRRTLQRDVVSIASSLGITLVIVTHDTEEAVAMADTIAVMTPNPGRLVKTFEVGLDGHRDPGSIAFKAIQDDLIRDLTTEHSDVNDASSHSTPELVFGGAMDAPS